MFQASPVTTLVGVHVDMPEVYQHSSSTTIIKSGFRSGIQAGQGNEQAKQERRKLRGIRVEQRKQER